MRFLPCNLLWDSIFYLLDSTAISSFNYVCNNIIINDDNNNNNTTNNNNNNNGSETYPGIDECKVLCLLGFLQEK